MSSMVVSSAERSLSGDGSLQPWQMVHSYSLWPIAHSMLVHLLKQIFMMEAAVSPQLLFM